MNQRPEAQCDDAETQGAKVSKHLVRPIKTKAETLFQARRLSVVEQCWCCRALISVGEGVTGTHGLPFGSPTASCRFYHTHTHTHTHKTSGHNSGSECQNPRQLDRQTRQSMSDANRRLSAAQVMGGDGYASWGMHRDLLEAKGGPWQHRWTRRPAQGTAKCQNSPGYPDNLGESGPAPTQYTHTHTHTQLQDKRAQRGFRVSESSSVERQTRQSMFAANRRLSAVTGTGREGLASWGMHRVQDEVLGGLWQLRCTRSLCRTYNIGFPVRYPG